MSWMKELAEQVWYAVLLAAGAAAVAVLALPLLLWRIERRQPGAGR